MKYLGPDRKRVMNCCSGSFHIPLSHPFVSLICCRPFLQKMTKQRLLLPRRCTVWLFSYLTALVIPFLSYSLEKKQGV